MEQFDFKKNRPIQELYTCLQGEGSLTGVPHILIRTTGCPLRCQFSKTDFCDSWYTSWHPEKGKFSVDDIVDFLYANPHIKHTMITGGSPTMHAELLKVLVDVCKTAGHYVTIETEGSIFVPTNADLISLSPKFSNSLPQVGTITPGGREVTEKDRERHEKNRRNWEEMSKLIEHHKDYQIKPVISSVDYCNPRSELEELYKLMQYLGVPKSKVYLMPAGGTKDELNKRRREILEFAVAYGFNYTDRLQIVAYNNKIGV